MQFGRTPTPFNTPPALTAFEKRCNKASCKVCYPSKDCVSPQIYPAQGLSLDGDSAGVSLQDCRPFGYQPKRHNPGSLKFYMYDMPFQTTYGIPYRNVGKGWFKYENTGKYYQWAPWN